MPINTKVFRSVSIRVFADGTDKRCSDCCDYVILDHVREDRRWKYLPGAASCRLFKKRLKMIGGQGEGLKRCKKCRVGEKFYRFFREFEG